MVKQPSKGNGSSRIRVVMIDAEIAEGELGQIAAAIQNALRPSVTVAQRPAAQLTAPTQNGGVETVLEEPMEDDFDEADEGVTKPAAPSKPRKPRKPTTPEVLELDLISDVSLESFAVKHPAEKESDRNLVIATWFKEHRQTPAITSSHVYTAYRQLKWSVAIEDFSWPLRYLKKEKFMGAGTARGEYVINHLGIDRVNKMATGG